MYDEFDNRHEYFDKDLVNEFNNIDFYAKPQATKIHFNFGDSDEIVGNAVVANLEEINEKIPIYSYNSSTFQKYLQGKRMVSGVIMLRKVTVANFLSLIKHKKAVSKGEDELLLLKNNLKELQKISGQRPVELIRVIENKITKLNNFVNGEYDFNEYSRDLSKTNKNNDSLLYYIENANNGETNGHNIAKINIIFNNMYGNGPQTNIKDVLFVKKQTEINIDKNDIFEIYSFIGNPDDNLYVEDFVKPKKIETQDIPEQEDYKKNFIKLDDYSEIKNV